MIERLFGQGQSRYRDPIPASVGFDVSYALKHRGAHLTTEQIQTLNRSNWELGAHASLVAVGDNHHGKTLTDLLWNYANRYLGSDGKVIPAAHENKWKDYCEKRFIEDFDGWSGKPVWDTSVEDAHDKTYQNRVPDDFYRPAHHIVKTAFPELAIIQSLGSNVWNVRVQNVIRGISPDKTPVLTDQKAMLALPGFMEAAARRTGRVDVVMPNMLNNSATQLAGFSVAYREFEYPDTEAVDGSDAPSRVTQYRAVRPEISLLSKGENGTIPDPLDDRFVFVGGGNARTTDIQNLAVSQIFLDRM